ncbi:MAG: hypothetical protein Q4D23_00615 [Bacteroidales bacterium]|nr:hypothetical protein [Bacteroidales bacterium]
MKKIYSLAFVVAMTMVPTMAMAQDEAPEEQPVSVEELNGHWLFQGVANDWQGLGVKFPTFYDITLNTIKGETNVTMTGFIGDLYPWVDEDYPAAINYEGVWNPEDQTITFTNTGWDTYVEDFRYDIYVFYVKFQAHKVDGKIWLNMVEDTYEVLDDNDQPTGETAQSLCTLVVYDYWDSSWETTGNYGYDLGGTLNRYYAGSNEEGLHTFVYNDAEGNEQTMAFNAEKCDLNGDGVENEYRFVSDDLTIYASERGYREGRSQVVTGLTLEYSYDEATDAGYWSNYDGVYNVQCVFDKDGNYITDVDLAVVDPSKNLDFVMYDLRIVKGQYVPVDPVGVEAPIAVPTAQAAAYNLAGQRLKDTYASGLFIQNGKKTIK